MHPTVELGNVQRAARALHSGRRQVRRGRIRTSVRPSIEFLEIRLTPATSTWTGAGVSGVWSDANNWDVAPQNGDDLVFPAGAAHLADSINDLTTVNSFASVTIKAGGYTITGNAITVTGTVSASQASGVSEFNLPLTLTAAVPTVSVDISGARLVLGGVIGGASLTKGGDGELDLTQANTYTGATTVNGGTLVVNGAQGQSAVTLGDDTTLGGTGTVGGIAATEATVSPGQNGPGILTDSGNLTLDSNSVFNVILNGTTAGTGYSQLVVAGTVDLGEAVLDRTLGFTPTANEQFTIIDNTGSSPVTGTFNGLAEGATISISGQFFRVSYVGGTGNDVVLTHLIDSVTTFIATPTTAVLGQSVNLTATVTPASGAVTPTGTVEFFAGTTSLGTAAIGSDGKARLDTTSLPLGASAVSAIYAGSTQFAPSSAEAQSVTITQASTTTSVVAVPSTSVFGQSVNLTATVSVVSPGTGTPSGTVEFFTGATSLGTGTLSNGTASLTTTALPVGSANLITAKYAGDTNYAASTSAATASTVSQAATTTTLTAAPNPSTLGASVTLTATVSAASPGAGTATGTVEFFAGTTSLGTATLNSTGVATLSTTSLEPGSSSLTARYQGDTNFTTSTSAALPIQVGLAVTTTVVAVSPESSDVGASVTFTATVSSSANNGTPTGLVAFYVGNNLLGTAALDANGVATITTSSLPVGNTAITAVYGGDSTHATSTSAAATASVGSDNQIFINQVYVDLMGRPADAKGLAYWSGLLDRGISRRVVVDGLVRSPEAVTQAIQSIYGSLLGTSATRAQLRAALMMNNPSVLNITASVLGSREFFRTQGGGTIDGYLGVLGDIFLGGPLPARMHSYFANELRQGVSTTTVAEQLLASSIGREATVEALFNTYLGREADRTGRSFYTRLLDNGFTPGQVTVDILNSRDYYDLALSQIGSSGDSSDFE